MYHQQGLLPCSCIEILKVDRLRTKFVFLVIILFFPTIKSQEIVNEYYSKSTCRKLIDQIIQKAGGVDNLRKAVSTSSKSYVNLQLLGLKISYPQTMTRKGKKFIVDMEIQGEKITTGFNGVLLWQKMNKNLYQVPERKKLEILETFQSLLPHQHILNFKEKDYHLKYKGKIKWKEKEVYLFESKFEMKMHRHYFSVENLEPVYSQVKAKQLNWEIFRSVFKTNNGISYPVLVTIHLDGNLFSKTTFLDCQFSSLNEEQFEKPNLPILKKVLQPFSCQKRLLEWKKALELFREYDPLYHSYPPSGKLISWIGKKSQIGNSRLKIGHQNLIHCPHVKMKNIKQLDYEFYSYFLKGRIHDRTPLIWDKKGNHKGGRNVLYADGSIVFEKESVFQSYLEKAQNRYPEIKVERKTHENKKKNSDKNK